MGTGVCFGCNTDFMCSERNSTKPYCDMLVDNPICSQCLNSVDCCTTDKECGSYSKAQCNTTSSTCEPCTTNSSCESFSKRFCVKGSCKGNYSIPVEPHCTQYDILGYCTTCATGFTLSDSACYQNCTATDNCTDSRSLAMCNDTLGYCQPC